MATINDIVMGALKRAEIPDDIDDIDPNESARALVLLNQMMQALKGRGINVMWATQALVDTFPLAPEHVEGVIALLAKKLANEFGKRVADEVIIEARRGYDALSADFKIVRPLRANDGLRRMPSQRQIIDTVT